MSDTFDEPHRLWLWLPDSEEWVAVGAGTQAEMELARTTSRRMMRAFGDEAPNLVVSVDNPQVGPSLIPAQGGATDPAAEPAVTPVGLVEAVLSIAEAVRGVQTVLAQVVEASDGPAS